MEEKNMILLDWHINTNMSNDTDMETGMQDISPALIILKERKMKHICPDKCKWYSKWKMWRMADKDNKEDSPSVDWWDSAGFYL